MNRILLSIFLISFFPACLMAQDTGGEKPKKDLDWLQAYIADSLDNKEELLTHLENLPNIEVGKGITFRPKNNMYEMTLRFRMQNMVGLSFGKNFNLAGTDAQVKRLRLRFDGYIFSPKVLYSIQLGFSGYDAAVLPNGNMNIIRDAIVYYRHNAAWNIGFGQTKIKANRARVNSSSALQFVDRSIVNSEFNVDRDFGLFGEYNYGSFDKFALSAKASVTLGDGRNWNSSGIAGFAYTGRLELYPFGRFHGNGELMEGDVAYEEKVKMMIAGAYHFNDNAQRLQGTKGSIMPDGQSKDLNSYFVDFILKYRGFATCIDYMGRYVADPFFKENGDFVFTGSGLNVQASYLFDGKWEIAARNSTIFTDSRLYGIADYKRWNQTTLGVTRYLIGHSLKIQFDISYNYFLAPLDPDYDRWMMRFQVELGL